MSKIEHAAHTTWNNRYHFVWIVKYRRNLLYDKQRCKQLRTIIEEIGARHAFTIDELATDGNHVHAFIGAPPRYSQSHIMNIIKSISARLLLKEDPELRKLLWGASLWGDGFFVRTVGNEVTEYIVKEYIKRQGQETHHAPFEQVRLF